MACAGVVIVSRRYSRFPRKLSSSRIMSCHVMVSLSDEVVVPNILQYGQILQTRKII